MESVNDNKCRFSNIEDRLFEGSFQLEDGV